MFYYQRENPVVLEIMAQHLQGCTFISGVLPGQGQVLIMELIKDVCQRRSEL